MHVKEIIGNCIKECGNIIFPKICLHCKEKAKVDFFCDECLSSFDLLDTEDIRQYDYLSFPVVTAFDDIGAINTFLSEMKKMKIASLAKVAASYMVYQHMQMGYEIPDIIIPLTDNSYEKRYIDVVTREIAKLFGKPVKKMVYKSKFRILEDMLFVKSPSLQGKRLAVVIDKIDEKKYARAVNMLEKHLFKDVNILSFCQ